MLLIVVAVLCVLGVFARNGSLFFAVSCFLFTPHSALHTPHFLIRHLVLGKLALRRLGLVGLVERIELP